MENQTEQDSLLTQFINITGADESIAKNALEACNWNVELAMDMFLDSNLAQTAAATTTTTSSSSSSAAAANNQSNNSSAANIITEEVRPPIPPVRQVLVEDYPRNMYASSSSGFDGFRNFQEESRWQEQQLNDEPEQSIDSSNRRRTFDDLFRPPLDLIYRGSFDMAKYEGQRSNKWLLVNIQNPKEFSCQVLNRDVWSNSAVKDIINEHFIFWQTYHDTQQGQNFISFYQVHQFPYISIIDPRTDTVTFCEKVTQFLNEHPSPTGKSQTSSSSSVVANNPSISYENFQKPSPYEESEREQIEAAIKASLQDMEVHNNHDDDDDDDDDCKIVKNDSMIEQQQPKQDDWRNYLGSDESNKMEIVIRYPNGNKEKVMFPSDSKLKALFLYVTEHGYNMNEYDLITNFPKKNLSSSYNDTATLENVGIHSRDTLYVQTKN
ncbi:ubx domain-containing protein 7-like protein [Dermatophagoides farinae]|uniref:Ubx domain-containing protein 7-like protein n=1 Tax=Dermatophagoides farinae TaxID=6954 RepID=A0A9D4P1F2_DERFA|nr:ubx domain-containing protein 7-like protein [Dermatophagoides farinae]